MSRYNGLIDRYRDRLPISDDDHIVTLCEGNTPLIRLDNLMKDFGDGTEIYAKFEGLNPTGSFKDRGMTMAVTQAWNAGSRAIICASTGNTSAAAAAYAARGGMRAFVLIPEGKIALGKLAQAMMHGAEVIQIRGNFDAGMQLVKDVAAHAPVTIVNSVNPFRLQGQKTAAFEICDALGGAPDYHCLPVGNAGNITAHWIGYSEYAGEGTPACAHCGGRCLHLQQTVTHTRPRMVGYQAAGSAPFMRGGAVEHPETIATAIRIGNPQSWEAAQHVKRESGGWFDEVSDEDLLETQKLLAEREGVFCEPASAVSLCGALKDLRSGRIPRGSSVVCTLTGHGLKDPDTAIRQSAAPIQPIDAKLDEVRRVITSAL